MDHETFIKAIQNRSDVLIFSLDTAYRLTFFTPPFQQLIRLTWNKEIMVGDNMLTVLPEIMQLEGKEYFDRALRGEEFAIIENSLDIEGIPNVWEGRFSPVVDDTGKIEGFSVMVRNITELVQTTQILDETRERLSLALKASHTGVWEWNIRTNAVYWSEEVYKLFSIPHSEEPITFESYLQSIHPEDRHKITTAIEASLKQQVEYNVEHRIFTLAQELRWIRGTGKVVLGKDGVPEKMVGLVQDITTEKEEHERVAQLAMVANTTTNMVIITDREGRTEWVNPAFEQITGYTLQEVLGKKPGSVLQGAGTNTDTVHHIRQKLKEGKGFKNVELINYTKQGKTYWVSLEVHPLTDNEGNVVKFVAVQTDVTEQKTANANLRESESRFRQIIEFSPMGILMYELNAENQLILIEVNDSARNILGTDTSKLIGLTLEEAFPPLARTEIPEHYRKAAQDGISWYSEELMYTDGEIDGAFQVHAFQAGTNRVAVFFLDITKRKKAEKDVQDWQKRYELIVQSSGQMIYDYDLTSGNILWSGNTVQILGFTNEEMGDINQWSALIHPDDRDGIVNRLQKAQQELSKFDVEYRFRNRKGNYKIVSDRGFFYADQRDPQNLRMLGIMEDITQKKETEQNLTIKNEELLKANEELDRFVYSASHDLRAPISSLLGLIQVARMEDSRDSLELLFNLQEKSLKKLDVFIRDIVDYSRNERLPLAHEPINLQRSFDDALEQFNFLEHTSKIRKDIKIVQDHDFVTDSKRFQIIVNNLLANAIKYADLTKEEPYLAIEADITLHRGIFRFSDNGEGIRPELHNQIFDMFFRASNRATGSGLGLYIVKEAVAKLNGEISVQSDYGNGSVFTVLLPNLAKQ